MSAIQLPLPPDQRPEPLAASVAFPEAQPIACGHSRDLRRVQELREVLHLEPRCGESMFRHAVQIDHHREVRPRVRDALREGFVDVEVAEVQVFMEHLPAMQLTRDACEFRRESSLPAQERDRIEPLECERHSLVQGQHAGEFLDCDEALQLEPRPNELPGRHRPRHGKALALRPLKMLPFLQPRRPRSPGKQRRHHALPPRQFVVAFQERNESGGSLGEGPACDGAALFLVQLVGHGLGHDAIGPIFTRVAWPVRLLANDASAVEQPPPQRRRGKLRTRWQAVVHRIRMASTLPIETRPVSDTTNGSPRTMHPASRSFFCRKATCS